MLWEAGLFRALWDRRGERRGTRPASCATRSDDSRRESRRLGRIAVILVGIVGLLVLVRLLSMIWSGCGCTSSPLARRRGPAHGVRTADAGHGDDSAATRADADDSRGAASASGEADVGARGNSGRSRRAGTGPQETARVARADHSAGSAVPALVREVLPGFDLDALDWHPLHPRAFRRAVKPALLIAVADDRCRSSVCSVGARSSCCRSPWPG